MRRMNYNPFEKPFASGKINETYNKFIIDRPLELNHIYYVIVYNEDRMSFGPSIIDLRNQTSYANTLIALYDNDDVVYDFALGYAENYKEITISHPTATTSYNYTIFIYQLI